MSDMHRARQKECPEASTSKYCDDPGGRSFCIIHLSIVIKEEMRKKK